ncbi:nucleolar and coiled-body phosphoprotein 1-like [Ostrea edulis]|uniref:nucleolar and coiled-body phosphoprotein 1-like n=1 Tax=Ostrea edulis TaxID=37623 RepID=UPI0024AFA3F0|nr:nucleolar and coiled-body phosphoprotein 1-like [Ostrea edulis]
MTTMPGVSSRTPRRRGPQRTPEKPAGLSPAKFYSPITPGWVSGRQMVFEQEHSPVINVGKERKSVMPTGTISQKATNFRRHTMFKLPEPVRSSPIGTRSRRSSIFNVNSRKGGIRLTIAVTPQEKPKKGPAKVLSPPGVKTRTRRSSVYQKGQTLQEACSQPLKASKTGQAKRVTRVSEKKESAVQRKAPAARRSVCPKSPVRTSKQITNLEVPSSQSSEGSVTRRKSVQPIAKRSEKVASPSPAKKTIKTPRRSTAESAKGKSMPEPVEGVFKTPARPVSSTSEDSQPESAKRSQRSSRKTPARPVSSTSEDAQPESAKRSQRSSRKTPVRVSKSMNDVKPSTPKDTASTKKTTPVQSASRRLRSSAKSKRSTKKIEMEQLEANTKTEVKLTKSASEETNVTFSPEVNENKEDDSLSFTGVKRRMDLTSETPQVKKVKVTQAVSETSTRKSRQAYRKTPAKMKGTGDVAVENISLDDSMEFKTPMKTPKGIKSSKTMTTADEMPQVKLVKLTLPNGDSGNEETKVETVTQENVDKVSHKTVQVVPPELSSPVQHSGKLAERKSTPGRVRPDMVNKDIVPKGKSKKESKIKKLKSKGKEKSTLSLNDSLNTSAHTSMGAKCIIL